MPLKYEVVQQPIYVEAFQVLEDFGVDDASIWAYRKLRIEGNEIINLSNIEYPYVKVGDYIRYDVRNDEYVPFDISLVNESMKFKLVS